MGRVRAYLGNLFTDQEFDVARRKPASGGAEGRLKSLEQDVEQLSVVLRALVDTLVRRDLLSREEIKALIAAIDASDGTSDGTALRVPMGRRDEPKKKRTR